MDQDGGDTMKTIRTVAIMALVGLGLSLPMYASAQNHVPAFETQKIAGDGLTNFNVYRKTEHYLSVSTKP